MPELTTNLGLEKPLGNETADIAVINSNMDKVDGEITKKASTTEDGRMSKEDKTKLDGVEDNANNYQHPAAHAPSVITQDVNNRFVTDAEKATWNAKETPSGAQTKVNVHANKTDNPHSVTKAQVGLGSVDNVKQATKAEFDAHVGDGGKHPTALSQLNGDSTHRTVTDAEKTVWNAKEAPSGAQAKVNAHANKTNNPHSVTKSQVGLGNVDNVKQATKTEFNAHVASISKHITGAGGDYIVYGYNALSNKSGYDNIAIGDYALCYNDAGHDNIAIGKNALGYNVTGIHNAAVGKNALNRNISGNFNTAYGNMVLSQNEGSMNTAIGFGALYSSNSDENTAVGMDALRYHQDGSFNTSSYNCSGLGYEARASGSNQVQLGNWYTTTYAYGAVQNRSDQRDKTDIQDTELGLAFILALQPRQFRWDYRDDYFKEVLKEDGTKALESMPKDGSKKRTRLHQGFIAQEVKNVMDTIGIDFAGYQDHKVNGGCDVLSIGYAEFIAPLVKAIQEQQQMIGNLKKEIEKLKVK